MNYCRQVADDFKMDCFSIRASSRSDRETRFLKFWARIPKILRSILNAGKYKCLSRGKHIEACVFVNIYNSIIIETMQGDLQSYFRINGELIKIQIYLWLILL